MHEAYNSCCYPAAGPVDKRCWNELHTCNVFPDAPLIGRCLYLPQSHSSSLILFRILCCKRACSAGPLRTEPSEQSSPL
jgi:hypothetical protein